MSMRKRKKIQILSREELRLRRWDFRPIPSEQSLEAVGKSVCLHIISRSKAFDLFPRTDKGKNRCVFRQNYALINSRERPQIFDINLEQSSHVETVCLLSNKNRKPDDYLKVNIDVDKIHDILDKEKAEKEAKEKSQSK